MSRIQRMKTLARVYLKSGPTVHLTGRPAQLDSQVVHQTQDDVMREVRYALTENQPIDAITTDGDTVLIPACNVQDVVFPQRHEALVVVPAQVFWGKAIHVRAFPAWLVENPDAANGCQFAVGSDPDQYTVVIGEDLGQSEIVVVNVATGHVAWANPACPEEAVTKSVAAAMLLGEAEELTNLAYVEHQTPLENQDLQMADIENANAHMARGDVQAALNIAGSEFVTAFLSESGFGSTVCVHVEPYTPGGDETYGPEHHRYSGYGVINGYDEAQKEFIVGLFEEPGEVRRRVEYIDEVMSYEWEDYQRTGTPLTDLGREHISELPVPDIA